MDVDTVLATLQASMLQSLACVSVCPCPGCVVLCVVTDDATVCVCVSLSLCVCVCV